MKLSAEFRDLRVSYLVQKSAKNISIASVKTVERYDVLVYGIEKKMTKNNIQI